MKYTENQRLKIFRECLKISQMDFANSLELKQGSYSDVERGKASVSRDIIIKLISIYRLNATWFYTGVGEMFINTKGKQLSGKLADKLSGKLKSIDLPDKNIVANLYESYIYDHSESIVSEPTSNYEGNNPNYIHLIDQRACAGTPGGFADVSHEDDRHIYLPDLPSSKSVIGITVSGDSMEPTLMQGDIVVCAKCDKPNQINKLSVYVICIAGEGASVKRYRSQDDDALYFSSDNRSYGNLTVPKSDIVELWEVMYRITPRIENPEIDLLHRMDDLEANIVEIKQMLKGVKTGKKG